MSALTPVSGTLIVLAALLAAAPAQAQNAIGRYQMVPLDNKPGSFDSRVMILDTSDGHLWQWWETPSIGGGAPNSGITYLGKVGNSGTVGETAPAHHTVPPQPIVPRH